MVWRESTEICFPIEIIDFGEISISLTIVGLPDPEWGEVLCAAVVAAPDATPTLAQLRDHCEGRLAGFKKPRRIALLDRLPRTAATSQVQRTMLVEEILTRGLAKE